MMQHPNRRHEDQLLADINVTPMVDVMLVLLIIFMITAPLIQQGVEVDLPQAQARELKSKGKPLIITLNAKGTYHINDQALPQADFEKKIRALIKDQPDRLIYLKADGKLPYDNVMKIIALLKESGATRLGMVSRIPEERS